MLLEHPDFCGRGCGVCTESVGMLKWNSWDAPSAAGGSSGIPCPGLAELDVLKQEVEGKGSTSALPTRRLHFLIRQQE